MVKLFKQINYELINADWALDMSRAETTLRKSVEAGKRLEKILKPISEKISIANHILLPAQEYLTRTKLKDFDLMGCIYKEIEKFKIAEKLSDEDVRKRLLPLMIAFAVKCVDEEALRAYGNRKNPHIKKFMENLEVTWSYLGSSVAAISEKLFDEVTDILLKKWGLLKVSE